MMFVLAEKEEIGQYLAGCIDEQFESRRQFCKKYLEAKGDQTDNEQIRNMSNRLSQILKGKKEIQLYDLPFFCRLLEKSCEDVLSAGKSHAPASMRLTNYTAAFSKDEGEWEEYVNRADSPILNADEYGKTRPVLPQRAPLRQHDGKVPDGGHLRGAGRCPIKSEPLYLLREHPLRYTDPSGHFWGALVKAAARLVGCLLVERLLVAAWNITSQGFSPQGYNPQKGERTLGDM